MRRARKLLLTVSTAAALCCGLAGTAAAGPAPTLGSGSLGGPPDQHFGWGSVRPNLIAFAPDPDTVITNVHWSSWGGPHAVGYGFANYIWPGWGFGHFKPYRAEVVAYGLSTCGGAPAYTQVAWFFPKFGQTFKPWRGLWNLCTGAYHDHRPKIKPVHCGSESVSGPRAVARNITAGGGASCVIARRLLGAHRLMRSLSRPTRTHFAGWWCGAGDVTTKPVYYACQRGNTLTISAL